MEYVVVMKRLIAYRGFESPSLRQNNVQSNLKPSP
ncbi:hypothetical protein CO2235_180023 [Cupriavidus oxalaticus]|uniref:Uncharacterized protein n=1 Tax=Cupriavidus oxalaticus TaxID=96344 RepID=A0A976BBU0_9BURK|nr:hypothetical protein CO2235_180023 [Cupriavidus oxalaticus]